MPPGARPRWAPSFRCSCWNLLGIGRAGVANDALERLAHRGACLDHGTLALRAVRRAECRLELDPERGARGRGPREQTLDDLAGRILRAAIEVDHVAVEPVADRPPHVLLDQVAGDLRD